MTRSLKTTFLACEVYLGVMVDIRITLTLQTRMVTFDTSFKLSVKSDLSRYIMKA